MVFVRQTSAEFVASGGKFSAPKIMGPFASFNAAIKTISLSRSEMSEAKLAALVEQLIHFKQAQRANVYGQQGGWFYRYNSLQWSRLSPALEQEADKIMERMGFH